MTAARKKTPQAEKPEIDSERIDDSILALMHLTTFTEGKAPYLSYRTWKGFDFAALARLHEKGMIENPKSIAKSVSLTEEGIARSKELFERLFVKKSELP